MVRTAVPSGVTAAGPSRLSDVAKVPLLQQETAIRVREIWLERFRGHERVVAGALAAEEFETLRANAAACPIFLVPIPRGEGYLNMMWQAQENRFIVRSVEAFQRGSEQVDLGIVLFPELLESHKIALLHAELQSTQITKQEAARVVRYVREAYADPVRFSWVQRFNERPREFDYDEFMSAFRPLERWHEAE